MKAAGDSDLPPEAFAVALASMPVMGPARLRRLLAAGTPAEVWTRENGGDQTSMQEVRRLWARHGALGIKVLLTGDPSYPTRPAR